jgi:hypothetical protein
MVDAVIVKVVDMRLLMGWWGRGYEGKYSTIRIGNMLAMRVRNAGSTKQTQAGKDRGCKWSQLELGSS